MNGTDGSSYGLSVCGRVIVRNVHVDGQKFGVVVRGAAATMAYVTVGAVVRKIFKATSETAAGFAICTGLFTYFSSKVELLEPSTPSTSGTNRRTAAHPNPDRDSTINAPEDILRSHGNNNDIEEPPHQRPSAANPLRSLVFGTDESVWLRDYNYCVSSYREGRLKRLVKNHIDVDSGTVLRNVNIGGRHFDEIRGPFTEEWTTFRQYPGSIGEIIDDRSSINAT